MSPMLGGGYAPGGKGSTWVTSQDSGGASLPWVAAWVSVADADAFFVVAVCARVVAVVVFDVVGLAAGVD